MEGSLSIAFSSPAEAKKALAALKPLNYDDRAKVDAKVSGSSLVLSVSAQDFTPLRSAITSLLRDVKVVRDSFRVVGEQHGHE